jgi:hypothetical protein
MTSAEYGSDANVSGMCAGQRRALITEGSGNQSLMLETAIDGLRLYG